jgi:hypothetical protein
MKVRPITETCRIRKELNLTCYGCQYRGEACEAMKTLLGVRVPAEASVLKVQGGKENVNQR